MPIWYQYTPGDEAWVLTGVESQKIRFLRDAGRFTLMAQRVEPTVRYVSVEGSISRITQASDEMHREMASRYLPTEAVDAYLEQAEAFGELLAVYLRPEHWLSADLGTT